MLLSSFIYVFQWLSFWKISSMFFSYPVQIWSWLRFLKELNNIYFSHKPLYLWNVWDTCTCLRVHRNPCPCTSYKIILIICTSSLKLMIGTSEIMSTHGNITWLYVWYICIIDKYNILASLTFWDVCNSHVEQKEKEPHIFPLKLCEAEALWQCKPSDIYLTLR